MAFRRRSPHVSKQNLQYDAQSKTFPAKNNDLARRQWKNPDAAATQ